MTRPENLKKRPARAKNPILLFFVIVGSMVVGMLWFIQSPRFALVAKRVVAKYMPKDLGIVGDFSELSVKLFPPGISLLKPRLTVQARNIANLPEGSAVQAERLDLNFRLFQAFTGKIRVNEVIVVDGDVRLFLDRLALEKRPQKKASPTELRWDELLQIRADAVALKNTKLHVELLNLGKSPGAAGQVDLLAKSVKVGQWDGSGGVGYALELEIESARAVLPMLQLSSKNYKIPAFIDRLRGEAHLNPAGLQLDELFVSASGVEVRASGAMKGNIMNPKALTFQGNVEGNASLAQVMEALQAEPRAAEAPASRYDGRVKFKGSVRGNMDRPLDSIKADGELSGTGIRVGPWHADSFKADGSWKATPAGGELTVTKAIVFSKDLPRLAPSQGASGGKIELGPVKVSLPLADNEQPLTLPVSLERAHIHWLGAGALKDVFPLDFRVTGPIKVSYRPEGPAAKPAGAPAKGPQPRSRRPWEIDAELGSLNVTDFQLDNQRLGRVKPLRRVLKVPRIVLDGLVRVDSTGIKPDGLMVELPKTKFRMGGKIDFKAGYDFTASGPVNLADLGEIAENPIRGEGTLSLHVHGPSSRAFLDFDTDLANAYYLGLDLGWLKGRITWDDDPSRLIFSDVRLRKGDTSYRGDGKLDLSDANTVDLSFQIPQGDVQDLIQVFGTLTKDVWWFPRSLSGPATGQVKVGGGIATKDLKISGRLAGSDWEYAGERFQSVAMTGGYDRGRYYVSDFRAVKRRGTMSGRISHGPTTELEWDLKTQDFTVSDIDHVARLDVPIRGRMSVSSTGKGREGAISSTTEASLAELAVRGVPMPSSSMTIRSENGVAEVKGTALGGQGNLELVYDFKPGGKDTLKGELKHLDFSPVLLLLNPRAIQDRSLAGVISGSAQFSFKTGEEDRATGRLEFGEYLLQKSGAAFRLERPLSVKVTDGSFEIMDAAMRGPQGEALLELRSNRGALAGNVSGTMDVSLVEFFTSAIARSTGTAELDFAIGGSMRAPTLFGKAVLGNASVQMSSLESPFENVSGSFQLKQNLLSVQNLEADLAGGRVALDGTIGIYATRFPQILLKGTVNGSRLKIYPFQFAHIKNATLIVKGDSLPYVVEGTAVIDSALSKEKVFQQRVGEGMKAVQYMPPAGAQSKGGYPLLRLNIDARADRGILIQNDLFDAEARGHVTVINTLEAPRILGTAEILPGSRMQFKDRTFQIQAASANFDNPTVINPSFSLSASTDVNHVKINLFASGRLGGTDQWKLELTSNPVMPESELISLLALGLTSADSKRLSSTDRQLLEQGEGMSLLLHSLDFNREVRNKTGLDVQIDESTNTQIGTSIFRPQAQAESTAAPRIVIRKQIGNRIELSAKSTIGVGASNQKEVNAELKVTPGLSVIGVWDNQEIVDTQKNTITPYGSYGLDLKVQKRFK